MLAYSFIQNCWAPCDHGEDVYLPAVDGACPALSRTDKVMSEL